MVLSRARVPYQKFCGLNMTGTRGVQKDRTTEKKLTEKTEPR